MEDVPNILAVLRIVKTWAKIEKLNKAYEGFLNSLGWTLLVLYFFMQTGDLSKDILRANADEVAAQDCNGMLDVPMRSDTECDRALCQEHVINFFDWVVATVSEWPEHPCGGAYGISLVDGCMIEVPPPAKQWADQCSFFVEDPGIRIRRGESANVARSVQNGPLRTTLERCTNAARSLKELLGNDESWSGQSEHPLDTWISNLEQTPQQAPQQAQLATPAPWQRAQNNFTPAPKMRAAQNFVPAPKKRAQTWPAAEAQTWPTAQPFAKRRAGELQTWPNAEPFAKRRKTQEVCQWFLKGECWSGDNCKKSHAV